MKKIISLLIMIIVSLASFSSSAFAQDDEKTSRSLLFFTGEYTSPEVGDSFMGWKAFGKHTVYRDADRTDSIGGFGATYKAEPDNDYWKVDLWGFITIPYGYDVSLGYSEKSSDARYVFAGVDHRYAKVGGTKWALFFDAKNFFALNDKGEGYLDVYTSALYPIGKRVKVGANVVVDHYWTGESREKLFAGGVGQVRLTDDIAIRARVGRTWDWRDRGDTYSDQIRLDLKFMF